MAPASRFASLIELNLGADKEMIFSVTELQSYMRCRRQWDLGSRNRQNLTRITPPATLALGTLLHAALADWTQACFLNPDDGGQGIRLRDLYVMHADRMIREVALNYHANVGTEMSLEEMDSLNQSVLLGEAMMRNYQERWGSPLPEGWELIMPEQRIVMDIPGTAHKLQGKLDGIARDTNGLLWTLERKSYAQRPRPDVLLLQWQFLAYHWLLTQATVLGDWGRVGGIAYDGMWKRPQPPKQVDGHAGTLKDLFCRIPLIRPQAELDEFEQHLAMVANEAANDPAIYVNRMWDGSCSWCGMNPLCTAISRGEDWEYVRNTQYVPKPPDVEMEALLGAGE